MVASEQYIGRRLTWAEAVSLFPDRWVAFKDYSQDHHTFKDGILEAVLPDEDVSKYELEHSGNRLYIERTTDTMNGGYINGVLVD